jgi:Zn-dependent metalloprotease
MLVAAAASVAAGIFSSLPLASAAPLGTAGGSRAAATPTDPNAIVYGSSSVFLSAESVDGGDLGTVPPSKLTLIQQDPNEVKDAAGEALHTILQERLGFTGQESILPLESQPIRVDKQQRAHIRYRQFVDGLPLEGATLAVHFDTRTGQVVAANGDVHSMDSITSNNNRTDEGAMDCSVAMELALVEHLEQHSVVTPADVGGEWKDECQLAAVQGRDGKPYLAYKRMYGFQPETKQTLSSDGTSNATMLVESEPLRLDVLFADRVTGKLVAVHPKVFGARTMTTYHCNSIEVDYPSQCTIRTNSSDKISTGDRILDGAHNNEVDVYDFYAQHFGRKGMDGNELKVQTLTHYGMLYNNAFFSSEFGGFLAYGDGDGFQYDYWAQLDVGTLRKRLVHFQCTTKFVGAHSSFLLTSSQSLTSSPTASLTSRPASSIRTRAAPSTRPSRIPWAPPPTG